MIRPLTEAGRRDWLRLARTENVGPVTFAQLIERYGEASIALAALPDLARRGGRISPLGVPPLDQINRELGGQGRYGVGIVRVDGVRRDQFADAGVARGRMDLGHVRVGKQGSDNGVFAAAGADDKYLHSSQGYFVDRAGS